MRIYFLCLLWFLLPVAVQAQTWPFELWHDGKIVLVEGDTLRGLVKYNIQQDLVQFNSSDRKVEAYTPRKVVFFEIFDASVHKYRQFYSLPFTTPAGYEAPIFFELLEDGKMTLLSREALEMRTYNSPYYVGSYSRLVLVNKYFFLNEKAGITSFSGTKKDLLELMEKRAGEVEDYIKTNRLDFDNKYDLARIIEYYNSLSGI